MIRIFFFHVFIWLFTPVFAQESIIITGVLTDEEGKPVKSASIYIVGTHFGSSSDDQGHFLFKAPYKEEYSVNISCISYKEMRIVIYPKPGEKMILHKTIKREFTELEDVTIVGRHDLSSNLQKIDMITVQSIPTSGSGVESLLKTLPGVSSNNEMSSQYNVRGGSFDENLIYVNDIEIYRPLLIRSGQQEGLSFINSDLVRSIRFSAGGFEARYGDKMSSVLDISYRRPDKFAGSASASILGGSATLEGVSANKKFTWLTGARYKSNQYLLGALDTKGEYKPVFSDVQTLLTYQCNKKWDMEFLGMLSDNRYNFIPEVKTTEFGSIGNVYQLKIYYEGQEKDRFNTSLGAFTLHYKPDKNLSMKWILSAFNTYENESYDLLGQYRISDMGAALEKNNDNITAIGVGSFLMHARNRLNANVMSLAYKTVYDKNQHQIRWGASWQKELINDKLDEWIMLDSAGYSLPFDSIGNSINLWESARANNVIVNDRIQMYIQDNYRFRIDSAKCELVYGIRANYATFTNELAISPRASISIKPDWDRDWLFYFSTGYYPQMPFFREMRDVHGLINKNLRSQKSTHFVIGGDYNFIALSRTFKLTSEIYYKYLWDLVPYKIDNVRLQYAAQNIGSGYATGIDFKINGELVKGTESWASLSLMQTREKTNTSGAFYPRPGNQFLHAGIFLQDYIANNPSYKVHVMFQYGTGLPVSNPESGNYVPWKNRRLPAYRRVDMGLSKIFKKEDKIMGEHNPLRHFKEIWGTIEILNVFDVRNTVSFMWLRSVGYQSISPGWFAVPNYLTPRLYNVKLTFKF